MLLLLYFLAGFLLPQVDSHLLLLDLSLQDHHFVLLLLNPRLQLFALLTQLLDLEIKVANFRFLGVRKLLCSLDCLLEFSNLAFCYKRI